MDFIKTLEPAPMQKSFRDELAMSMPIEALPKINDQKTMDLINKKLGIEFGQTPLNQIEWSIKYQCIIRYIYADMMLETRNEKFQLQEPAIT